MKEERWKQIVDALESENEELSNKLKTVEQLLREAEEPHIEKVEETKPQNPEPVKVQEKKKSWLD